ncbi:MAG TPA: type VI secretion system accessory protein TagJ, partial [Burkholderiaceae bacterium]|nr:type VI secretion system accessory protein TagJ [Burkholderiaceae bacterium]
PVLEAYINGRYYWVPLSRLSCVRFEKPEDLRDYVWLPAHLDFTNGGETLALIPSRYPGSQASADGAVQLGRRTDWLEAHPDVWTGLGQRMFSSDQGEHPMLGLERIDFNVTADA